MSKNVDRIFGLFDDEMPEGERSKIIADLEEFNDSMEFNLGMFTKLIQNNIVFNEKLKKFFKDIGKKYDEETTKKSSEHTVFNRSWHYLNKVDPDSDEFIQVILEHDMKFLSSSLERALIFFESSEEYEKCAHIHKMIKLIKAI